MSDMELGIRAKQILSKRLGIPLDSLALDAGLVDDLGLDSIDIVELTIATEQEFNIMLGDDELQDVRTVRDLVAVVERLATPQLAR